MASTIQDNRSKVRQVLIITLLLNLLVMSLKAVVGLITGSLSLQADALHSVTDSANNVLGLVASHYSSPYPDSFTVSFFIFKSLELLDFT